MNITLQPEQEKFIQSELATGNYNSADQLIAEALKLLEQRKRQKKLLPEIRQIHWKPSHTVPDSVTLLREMRGYDD